MRLKYMFELIELDDWTIAIPVGEQSHEVQGVIKLNKTAAYIFDLLRDEVTENTIIMALEKKYDATHSQLEEDVHKCIETFKARGIITD